MPLTATWPVFTGVEIEEEVAVGVVMVVAWLEGSLRSAAHEAAASARTVSKMLGMVFVTFMPRRRTAAARIDTAPRKLFRSQARALSESRSTAGARVARVTA